MDENFIPSTPTEVMLYNEIRKLKIQIYEIGINPDLIRNSILYDPPFVTDTFKDTITLKRSARLIASIIPYGGINVRLDVKYGNNEEFGSQYMLSEREKLTKNQAANLLIHLHREQLETIGRLISK